MYAAPASVSSDNQYVIQRERSVRNTSTTRMTQAAARTKISAAATCPLISPQLLMRRKKRLAVGGWRLVQRSSADPRSRYLPLSATISALLLVRRSHTEHRKCGISPTANRQPPTASSS